MVLTFFLMIANVTGIGQPVTSTGMEAWQGDLSRDGTKFAFSNVRGGKWEVWEKSLQDGQEGPVLADEYKRQNPKWSPDGTRLTYMRYDKSTTSGRGPPYDLVQPEPPRRGPHSTKH